MKNAIDFDVLHFLTQNAKQSPQERRFRLTLRNAEPLRGSICSEQRETSLLRLCLTDVFRNITANAAGPVKGSTAQPKTGPHAE